MTVIRPMLVGFLFMAGGLHGAERDIFDYAGQRAAPAGCKRIVFIASRQPHGGPGNHEFMAGSMYLARRINAHYREAHAVVHPEERWPSDLLTADAVIVALNHGGRAAGDPNIKSAMARGAGFMAIHFGVEVEKGGQGDNYLDWMGGYFETYWSVNPWWTADITHVGDHPTTRGVKPFRIHDEWYYHMRFREKMQGVTPVLSAIAPRDTVHYDGQKPSDRGGNAEVLRAVEAREPQHLAWAYQRPGGGRGFGFTGFHVFANLGDDGFRTTLLNGAAWVAGLEVPRDGVPSARPGKAELDALIDEAHRDLKD
jgi:hypothetical protein